MSEDQIQEAAGQPVARAPLLIAALSVVLDPGEDVGYSELLLRLTTRVPSFNTAGIGSDLGKLAFRGHTGDWRGAEFISYRVPFFDHEHEGDWTEGELRIVRREVAS